MKDTCMGCARFKLIQIRRQWTRVCGLNGKTIPFRPCMMFVSRFENAK